MQDTLCKGRKLSSWSDMAKVARLPWILHSPDMAVNSVIEYESFTNWKKYKVKNKHEINFFNHVIIAYSID